jgi:2-oxoisovalerate dehydrogenase E1 component alpha subunit
MHQCFSTGKDLGKGRQMPVHYGSKDLHFQTISSPLTTQLPQAAGSGYAFRLEKNDRVAMCYFGEGAASEGDFHAALNFASTLKSQTIFFCRNNGYAISTPVADQYKGDGIVSRGPGYGIHSIRVDGNDLLAVYQATKEARKLSISKSVPVLIESMTYRISHHSTSDDSTRYRKSEELKYWQTERNPISRIKKFLINQKLWTEEEDKALKIDAKKKVMQSLEKIEHEEKVPVSELFTDVYDVKPKSLVEQENELHEHLSKYSKYYESAH